MQRATHGDDPAVELAVDDGLNDMGDCCGAKYSGKDAGSYDVRAERPNGVWIREGWKMLASRDGEFRRGRYVPSHFAMINEMKIEIG